MHAPEVVKRFAAAYQKASKKGRGEVLAKERQGAKVKKRYEHPQTP